jgi:ferredoxin
MGPCPTERLPRAEAPALPAGALPRLAAHAPRGATSVAWALDPYLALHARTRNGAVVPAHPVARAENLRAADVERCTRYRVTNPRGSACGRCMKMCPWNAEGLLVHALWRWIAIHVPPARRWLARLDDWIGHGRRNPVKKWWFDLEWIDGVAVTPPQGTNERDLGPDLVIDPAAVKIALFPLELRPPPGAREPVPVDRRAGLRAAAGAESPARARPRLRR